MQRNCACKFFQFLKIALYPAGFRRTRGANAPTGRRSIRPSKRPFEAPRQRATSPFAFLLCATDAHKGRGQQICMFPHAHAPGISLRRARLPGKSLLPGDMGAGKDTSALQAGALPATGGQSPGAEGCRPFFHTPEPGPRPASPPPDGLRRTGAATGRKKAHIGTCCREYIGEQEVRK